MVAAGRLPVGEGVDNFMSSFEITLSGLRGTKPAPRNPDLTFSGVKILTNTAWKAIRNSAFVIWFTCAFINPSISRPYARFNGLKHPTLSGWSRCDECGGIETVIMFFVL